MNDVTQKAQGFRWQALDNLHAIKPRCGAKIGVRLPEYFLVIVKTFSLSLELFPPTTMVYSASESSQARGACSSSITY